MRFFVLQTMMYRLALSTWPGFSGLPAAFRGAGLQACQPPGSPEGLRYVSILQRHQPLKI
jgi:hypothetical protein